jgi:hypothetical protein
MRVFQDLPGEAAALATASRSKSGQTLLENPENKVVLVGVNERKSLPSKEMETKGIEPSFRRCDRRVLPLHHVPRTFSPYSTVRRRKVKVLLSAFGRIT